MVSVTISTINVIISVVMCLYNLKGFNDYINSSTHIFNDIVSYYVFFVFLVSVVWNIILWIVSFLKRKDDKKVLIIFNALILIILLFVSLLSMFNFA